MTALHQWNCMPQLAGWAYMSKTCAGSMQLRKLRQLCERLFKLPALPAVVSIESPEGAMQSSHAEGATLADLDIIVRPPSQFVCQSHWQHWQAARLPQCANFKDLTQQQPQDEARSSRVRPIGACKSHPCRDRRYARAEEPRYRRPWQHKLCFTRREAAQAAEGTVPVHLLLKQTCSMSAAPAHAV